MRRKARIAVVYLQSPLLKQNSSDIVLGVSDIENLPDYPLYASLRSQMLFRVEELQHQLAHQCSPSIIGIWEWGICGLMGGAFIT